jgi:hypothetical protein
MGILPGEAFSTDICSVSSPGDAKQYFVTYVDHASDATIVFALTDKSAQFECFKEVYSSSETQTGRKMKSLLCDNACENVRRGRCLTALRSNNRYETHNLQWDASSGALYFKSAANMPQRNYHVVTDENFNQMSIAWRNMTSWQTRHPQQSQQFLEFFIYCPRSSTPASSHRETAANIEVQMGRIREYIETHESEAPVGPAELHYWSTNSARRPHEPLRRPQHTTAIQLLSMDEAREELENEDQEAPEMATVTVRINNVMVPIEFSITELQSALGLSHHTLSRRGIFSSTPTPVVFRGENIDDVDHDPENVFGMDGN